MAFHLARDITQVLDAVPWVRCASGNVYLMYALLLRLIFCRFFGAPLSKIGREGEENILKDRVYQIRSHHTTHSTPNDASVDFIKMSRDLSQCLF